MSISERLSRVFRAQVTDLVARAEDPRKIVEQAIQDLRAEYAQARTETARAMAEGNRLRREWRALELRADTMNTRAEEALRRGQESAAFTALKARRDALELAGALSAQVERHEEAVAGLQTKLHAIEGQILELQGRQRLLAARESIVRTSERLEQPGPGRMESALDVVQRMERKVVAREDEAEARAMLGSLGGTGTLEQEQRDAELDAELQAMRQKLRDLGGES